MLINGTHSPHTIELPADLQLEVQAVVGGCRVSRMGDKGGEPDLYHSDLAASDTRTFGPFARPTRWSVLAPQGTFFYQINSEPERHHATALGIIEAFSGNRTLRADDNGRILKCVAATPCTVTVPADLPEGFNVAVAQWGAGTVTFSAGSGATNRSSATGVAAQYGMASLLVVDNADDESAEFVLGGDVA